MVKLATIYIKQRIERFYDDAAETVFVLYEDVDGNVHYQSIGYDAGRQQMLSQQFYKEFTRSDLQADRSV
ncbi:hypothetical protein NSS79_25960 [Paenibacillus sp. FSL L8-0436]|uniref:hypothetical protein n=1 Tax=Paenibacillus sp. FSL L8-0436 TaxID=2954686 RepID=UPI003158C502